MADWFRKQPKIGTQRLPQAPMPPLPATPSPTARPGLPALPPLPALPAGGAATPPPQGRTPVPRPGWMTSSTPTQISDDKTTLGAGAKVVMHHFARSEVRSLTRQADSLHAQVVERLRGLPEFANASPEQLEAVITQVTYRLQQSNLTINFAAGSWFAAPNQSRSYQQMYERGVTVSRGQDGQRDLKLAGNAMNKANIRDEADTRVTFGDNVNTPQMQGVARLMQTGGVQRTNETDASKRVLYKVRNGNFNQKARQNFVALDYARRRHGPAPEYGSSVLILKDRLKTNAIFYMGDTFSEHITSAHRATYGMIFSLILHADDKVLTGLLNATYRGMYDPADWNGQKQMIEAHIFEEIRFSEDVKEMVLRIDPTVRDPASCLNHAKVFCHSNGIKLTQAMD
jgi:hypothetical protein